MSPYSELARSYERSSVSVLPIHLIPLRPSYTPYELRTALPIYTPIIAPDFVIHGDGEDIVTKHGLLLGKRLEKSRILNIDHHMHDPRVWRQLSSTNQAISFIEEFGYSLFTGSHVAINHTDADSVLSSQIIAGLLPPDELFGTAAIAADHTGEENAIADLLQALEPLRDFEYSVSCLHQVLAGSPLPHMAQDMLENRLYQREASHKLVASGAFIDVGAGIYYSQTEDDLPGEFFPALIPQASLIVRATPFHKDLYQMSTDPRWKISVRSGVQFPLAKSINMLLGENMSYGGRWNAGSTARHGGWPGKNPEVFASLLYHEYMRVFN